MNTLKNQTVLVIEASAKAALPVMESLAKRGLRVAGASSTRMNAGFFSVYCHKRYVYPNCQYHPDGFKEWLIHFLRTVNIEQVFPVGHYGAVAVSEIQDEVRRYSRLVMPEHEIFLKGYEKIPTLETAMKVNVPIPDTWFPGNDASGLEDTISKIERYPVLIKPSVGVGANGIVWCHTPDEIRYHFPRIAGKHGTSYIQDFVPPGGMQYKLDMVVDYDQTYLGGVVYGKTRMYPPDGGSSVLNYTEHRPDILEYAHTILKELKWVGLCDFDFVVDPRDGIPKLLEINPRFPESFRMGTSVGIDFPGMLYNLAHDLPVEPVYDYPANRFLRFLPGDILWFLRVDNKRRFGTWPGWFRFFDSDTTYQLCSIRDPGPIIGYFLENIMCFLFDPVKRQSRLRLDSGPKKNKREDIYTPST